MYSTDVASIATTYMCVVTPPPLLRLYGGYEALKGGKTSEAMVDFTGGVVESIELAKAEPDLFNKILKNSQRSSLMSCSVS